MEQGLDISFAITACNEELELEKLLQQIEAITGVNDEVVLQLDTNATPGVKRIANLYLDKDCDKCITYPLNKDFSQFKNNLKNQCSREYIVFLDADELLSDTLALNIHQLLKDNRTIEVFWLPRANYVEGITPDHVTEWKWVVDDKQRINYPDYQGRIIKNLPQIKWYGSVHEQIIGADPMLSVAVPGDLGLDIIHNKEIKRQELQNKLYQLL
mgnify:CR=1 FL=1